MGLGHDRCAIGQLAEVADDRFRLAAGTARAAGAAGALGAQLALGQHRDARIVQREAVFQRRHRDREARVAGEEAGQWPRKDFSASPAGASRAATGSGGNGWSPSACASAMRA
ncbi:hypothetical protein G6F59_017462 [Rhizopus arrhizus]|nr:hypothetical protein G6F59_017462 [Rhizopus arrhizus]